MDWFGVRLILAGLSGLIAFSSISLANLPEWSKSELTDVYNRRSSELRKLIGAIDPQFPRYHRITSAENTEDKAALVREVLSTFTPESAGHPDWLPPLYLVGNAKGFADDVLEDRFTFMGNTYTQPRTAENTLDWDDRGPNSDPEWSWTLNRHSYFGELMEAGRQTKDPSYVRRISADIIDWTDSNPSPGRLTFSSSWRSLEVARRVLNSWTHIFYELAEDSDFTPEARLMLIYSVREHAVMLENHYSFWGGNHLLTETIALATIARAWPQFLESPGWRNVATQRFREELLDQTYPDGSYKELSNHYHRIILSGAKRFMKLIDTGSSEASDYQDLEVRIQHLERYFEGVARPDGSGPLNNAADREWNFEFLGQQNIERRFPTTRTTSGKLSPCLYFPWAGHAIMRDSWESSHQWAFFDIGPYGSGHQHEDTLQLDIWMNGGGFITDRGRYTYQPGEWRDYFKGPHAHNVVLIDGKAPLPGPKTVNHPIQNPFTIEEDYALFSGKAAFPATIGSFRSPPVHQRIVFYRMGVGWIVLDQISAHGSHRIEALWNFDPKVSDQSADPGLVLLQAHDAQSTIEPEIFQYRGTEDPIRGWQSEQFGDKEPALEKVYCFRSSGPLTLIWAIAPEAEKVFELEGYDRRTNDFKIIIQNQGVTELWKLNTAHIEISPPIRITSVE